MLLVLVWLFFGFLAGVVGTNRSGGWAMWFFLGLVFGPFALLAAFFAGKECPYCKHTTHVDAVVCPHCQSDLKQEEGE